MIQQDRISQTLIVLATFIFVYLFTIAGTAVVLFPLTLLLLGIVLHRFVQKKRGNERDDFDDTEITNQHLWKNFFFYTIVALFGVFMVSEAISVLPLSMNTGLTGIYLLLYLALTGIAEEQFFRGFITDWLLSSLPNRYVALLVSGGVFCIYHFAVYGTQLSSLIYVLAGGFILSWTAYQTRHISPCMAGHLLNNVGAYFAENSGISTGIRFAVKIILKVI
jgi:membrane protease YdiL (CAAX protease family)